MSKASEILEQLRDTSESSEDLVKKYLEIASGTSNKSSSPWINTDITSFAKSISSSKNNSSFKAGHYYVMTAARDYLTSIDNKKIYTQQCNVIKVNSVEGTTINFTSIRYNNPEHVYTGTVELKNFVYLGLVDIKVAYDAIVEFSKKK